MTRSDITKITTALRRIHEKLTESESESWTITNGVFFASTVVTTIGESFLYTLVNTLFSAALFKVFNKGT